MSKIHLFTLNLNRILFEFQITEYQNVKWFFWKQHIFERVNVDQIVDI
jgi:hypothetical protein